MNFTFGIITDGHQDNRLQKIIESIVNLQIPNFEIIVVGNTSLTHPKLQTIPFNESIKKAWITKKKNLITENAAYENIVYTHDYVMFEPDYYTGWLKFGNNYNACMTRILQIDGKRFTDWVLWPLDAEKYIPGINETRECHLPYDCTNLSKIMYFSGTYFVAKKTTMQEIPFNEDLCWGEGEDVIWSQQYRKKYNFSINPYSTVKLCKQRPVYFRDISSETLKKIQNSFNK